MTAFTGGASTPSASFTRPANTTAYSSGQLVANSTVAASVVPLVLPVLLTQGGAFSVRRVKLAKSGTTILSASFRVHLFTTLPTVATTGDAGVFATVVSGNAGAFGRFDVTLDQALADGSHGQGIPLTGSEATGWLLNTTNIWALIEARAGYTPLSAEVLTLSLEVLQN